MSKALESVFQTGRKQVDDLLDSVTNLGDIEVKEQNDDESQDDLAHATADGDDAPAVKLVNLVLLRAQAPDVIWPQSLEAQLMETNAGDFYVIGGVETAEHLDTLAALDCDIAQGFLFSRPMPAGQLPAWLRGSETRLRVGT